MPRISDQPKIWISTKSPATSGMIRRTAPTSQAAEPSSGQAPVIAAPPAGARCWLGSCSALWTTAMSAPQQALRPEGQHEHHDEEGQHHRVGRHVDRAELLGEADDAPRRARPRDRAHAADDHHHQRGEQEARVLARRQRLEGAADDAGDAGKAGAEGEDERGRRAAPARPRPRACRGRRRRRGSACRCGCG